MTPQIYLSLQQLKVFFARCLSSFVFVFSLIKTASDRMCGNDDFSTSFTYTVNHKCLQQIKRRRNHLFNDFH